jgi:hypothetical protein
MTYEVTVLAIGLHISARVRRSVPAWRPVKRRLLSGLTQTRACQVGACSVRVPVTLTEHGVCLGHYLEDAFARVSSALEMRRRGKALDGRTIAWLQAQGDFVVQLLSKDSAAQTAEERTRLLELLLCLANVQEYSRQKAGPVAW